MKYFGKSGANCQGTKEKENTSTRNVKTTIFTPQLNIEQQTPQKTSKEELENLVLITLCQPLYSQLLCVFLFFFLLLFFSFSVSFLVFEKRTCKWHLEPKITTIIPPNTNHQQSTERTNPAQNESVALPDLDKGINIYRQSV